MFTGSSSQATSQYKKTKQVFSAIPIDQAHEQNNARVVVQLASQIIQMLSWMIAGPEIASVIYKEFENSYLENNGEVDTHLLQKCLLSGKSHCKPIP